MSIAIALPTVHLNGSGQDLLHLQQHVVLKAIYGLRIALAEAVPHGRDYFLTAEYESARAQWERDMTDLLRIEQRATAVRDHVFNAAR